RKNRRSPSKSGPYPQLFCYQHYLGQNKSINECKTERFVIDAVFCKDDRLIIGEKREQKPEIEKHRQKFTKVVEDPFLECSFRSLLAGVLAAFSSLHER